VCQKIRFFSGGTWYCLQRCGFILYDFQETKGEHYDWIKSCKDDKKHFLFDINGPYQRMPDFTGTIFIELKINGHYQLNTVKCCFLQLQTRENPENILGSCTIM
jgi:hypothetical protein